MKGNHSNVVVSVVENNRILVVSVLKENHRNWLLIVVLKLCISCLIYYVKNVVVVEKRKELEPRR